MSAVGFAILMFAIFVGYEAVKHIQSASADVGNSNPSSGGSSGMGSQPSGVQPAGGVSRIGPIPSTGGSLVGINGQTLTPQIQSWIQQAMQQAGVSGTNWLNGLGAIIWGESNNTVGAINNTDVNAQSGNNSFGLAQTTYSTFYAYCNGHCNPSNPIDQIAAAINYIKATYGDIGVVPGIQTLQQYTDRNNPPARCPNTTGPCVRDSAGNALYGCPNWLPEYGGWYCPY